MTRQNGFWFVALPLHLVDAARTATLHASDYGVLVSLFQLAKLQRDTGVAWASAPSVVSLLRGLSSATAQDVLQRLATKGFVRSLRTPGAKGDYPIVVDGYLKHFDGAWHRVDATATTRWDRPVYVLADGADDGGQDGTQPGARNGGGEPENGGGTRRARTQTRGRGGAQSGGQSATRDGGRDGTPLEIVEPETGERDTHTAPGAPPAASLATTECTDRASTRDAAAPAGITADGLADLWAEVCPSLSQPVRPLAAGVRKELAAAARRESGRDWRATFGRVAGSAFLTGGRTSFRASVLWAIGAKNLPKIDAGQYDDAPAGAGPPRRPTKADELQDMARRYIERQRAKDAGAVPAVAEGNDHAPF